MPRKLALAAAGLALGLATLALLRRDDLIFYARLLRVYQVGQRFYRTYEHLDRDLVFHPQLAPRLDVYSPGPATDAGYPVLVFIHGGSWKDYGKELFAPIAMKLLPEPMVVVIPDYTLYPNARYEQMTVEVAAAFSWVLENIHRYGGDPERVVVVGHSSGAHLSALALLNPSFLDAHGHRSAELCGMVGLSGVYDIDAQLAYDRASGRSGQLLFDVMGGEANFAAASPLKHVRPDLPPILLIHGELDETVPMEMSVNFHVALQAAGARSRLKLYPDAGHSDFLLTALGQERAEVVADLADVVGGC